jgi:hypothetical protein
MSDQEIPIKEQEQPLSEDGAASTEEHIPEEHAQRATPPPTYEQFRPTTPQPPYAQPPYTWPVYAPGTGQQWRGGRPYASPPYSYVPRRTHWPWIVLIVVMLFVLLASGAFFLAGTLGYNLGSTSTTTQHYTVGANPTIVLNNDTGSIHVRVGASSDVTVQATKHTGWGGNTNDMNVTYSQDRGGNTVSVNVERPSISTFGSSSVDFDLTVPGAAVLQLKTSTGSIDVSGVSGQMVLTSNTGSVQAIGGALNGNSQLLTNTGSVTFSGSLSKTGTYQFQTNTGSVDVTIPGTSVFHVDASTDTGSINSNFPEVVVIHRQFTGADAHSDVGSAPQAIITLRTNTGSINLNQG